MANHHGPALLDWLTASAYVKGSDQTAKVVGRKKHRSKRRSAISELESARMETEERVRVLWKLSNRHYRRWMNDRLLRELAPPLDAQEIGSLFAPPPWGERFVSPFEKVTELAETSARDMAAWEPFRNNVDMDVEAKALQQRAKPRRKKQDSDVLRYNAALAAWRSIEHQSRDAIRRCSSWHLVEAFEEEILAFFMQMEEGSSELLVLAVDNPYHRMLLHGVCQFHGLLSQTVLEEREDLGMPSVVTRVHIKKKQASKPAKSSKIQQEMPCSLMQFLETTKSKFSFPGAAA